jgi:hypothetical protein
MPYGIAGGGTIDKSRVCRTVLPVVYFVLEIIYKMWIEGV